MPSLKDLRLRISSVTSTRKITSAMKMVAASKLRRAQAAAEAARPYSQRLERMLGALANSVAGQSGAPRMLAGTGEDKTHLIIVVTSDRGLCGGFNGTIVRATRLHVQDLHRQGKQVKLIVIGRKGRDQLQHEFGDAIIDTYNNLGGKQGIQFVDANRIAGKLTELFDANGFDVASIIYNRFKSVISQVVTVQQLVPFPVPEMKDEGVKAVYEFEPDEETILHSLLPRNLAVQIFHTLLESFASEQGARMTAMDNATRNAGDMINKLSIRYNRTRQAKITTELTEIISGAEAL